MSLWVSNLGEWFYEQFAFVSCNHSVAEIPSFYFFIIITCTYLLRVHQNTAVVSERFTQNNRPFHRRPHFKYFFKIIFIFKKMIQFPRDLEVPYVFWYQSIALMLQPFGIMFICFKNFDFVLNFSIFASRSS
jgi:hypothetical protein